ncbi:MAG: glucose 1-dehydrogenase [Alphaproteobacteria bacterium]|nr:glucose 1-dehydrogenase [Alphaproteobacteria bacterium]
MENNRFDVSGRVVIITGAGQGIGRDYALAFAEAGAIPVLAEINGEKLRNVAAEIEAKGGQALAVETDVGSPDSVAAMVAATLDAYGKIDVLINNAAVFATIPQRKFYEIPYEEWNKVLHVNITGSYLCASAVTPAMRAAGQGRIINISSGTVPQGVPGFMHYVTSKAAIVGMTRVMARELGDDNINVNAVMPGYTETEVAHASMDPDMHAFIQQKRILKRPETPDDLIGTILFLASPASSFITGQSIACCGGEVML